MQIHVHVILKLIFIS